MEQKQELELENFPENPFTKLLDQINMSAQEYQESFGEQEIGLDQAKVFQTWCGDTIGKIGASITDPLLLIEAIRKLTCNLLDKDQGGVQEPQE